MFGLMWYRTGMASIIHKELLDSEYMVVFLYVPKQKRQRAVGSTYYIQFAGLEGAFDIAHPYIAFQNHSGDPLLAEWRNRDSTSGARAHVCVLFVVGFMCFADVFCSHRCSFAQVLH